MQNSVSTAIVGTGQSSNQDLSTGTPIDALTTQLEGEIERKLLLTAGAFSLYQQAGYIPGQAPEAPQPAGDETIPVCSTKVGHLLNSLLEGEQRELLPEALHNLKEAKQRLPYDLLPLALRYGTQSKEIRPAIFAVLGERGRWLSQFEKQWAWATQFLAETPAIESDETETIWQEGTLGQRCELLAHIRTTDPEKAREWLSKVWKKEKAEARAQLLSTLKTCLSSADEPFLEKALDDRSEQVKVITISLLARIPNSAFAQRMLARADAMLNYTDGAFSLTLPSTIDATWQRDGIAEPDSKNPKLIKLDDQSPNLEAWYARQILLLIPPTHWEERFSISPTEIFAALPRTALAQQEEMRHASAKHTVAAFDKSNSPSELLPECWSYAITLFDCPNWLEPLWAWLCHNPYNYTIHDTSTTNIQQTLGRRLPQQVAEKYIQEQFGQNQSEPWVQMLPILPTPWSEEFGNACLETLRKYILALDGKSYPTGHWQVAFTTVALALPPACFQNALEPWQFPENTNWQTQQWKQQLNVFNTLLLKRQQIIEEMH